MRNVLKLIKYLSLALCFGLYLNLSATSAVAQIQNTNGTFWSASKQKNVSWNELTQDEQQMIAQLATMENATGKDKVNAAEQKLKEAKASGDAAKIQEAQAAYDKAEAAYNAALKVYTEQRDREDNKHGASSEQVSVAADNAYKAAEKTQEKQGDRKSVV